MNYCQATKPGGWQIHKHYWRMSCCNRFVSLHIYPCLYIVHHLLARFRPGVQKYVSSALQAERVCLNLAVPQIARWSLRCLANDPYSPGSLWTFSHQYSETSLTRTSGVEMLMCAITRNCLLQNWAAVAEEQLRWQRSEILRSHGRRPGMITPSGKWLNSAWEFRGPAACLVTIRFWLLALMSEVWIPIIFTCRKRFLRLNGCSQEAFWILLLLFGC